MDLNGNSRHPWNWFVLVLSMGHLALAAATMGVRPEHVIGDFGLLLLAWSGPRGRRFTQLFLPFWLTAVLYDGMRLYQGLRGTIHVDDLYHAELKWFGIQTAAGLKILPDVFLTWTTPALDFICGLAYIVYLYEPFLLLGYFYFRIPERFPMLAWGFLLLNVLGILTYLLYPAAPPWYVQQYGFGPARLDAPPSAAGAAKFDELTGLGYFAAFYARSPNVFGAMPSLHSAYPVLSLCMLWGFRRSIRLAAAAFALLVAFSAVYLRHHYVWDVLFGMLYAVVAFAAVYGAHAYRRRGQLTYETAMAEVVRGIQ